MCRAMPSNIFLSMWQRLLSQILEENYITILNYLLHSTYPRMVYFWMFFNINNFFSLESETGIGEMPSRSLKICGNFAFENVLMMQGNVSKL